LSTLRYVGAKVPNYIKKEPPIPNVWPIKLGTNLTQEEVNTLTSAGFRHAAKSNVIKEELLPPTQGPPPRHDAAITTVCQLPSRR
jgi:hypothetical protein